MHRSMSALSATSRLIADIRLASTLEFLHAIDYHFPVWATHYMVAMEKTLGAAYTEPAADVRGYLAYVTGLAADEEPRPTRTIMGALLFVRSLRNLTTLK